MKSTGVFLAGVLSVGIVVSGIGIVAPSVEAAPSAGTVDSVLMTLPVAPVVAQGYAFKSFATPTVARKNGRGCGKREAVLVASASVRPAVGGGCSLSGGSWKVNHGSRSVSGAGRVDVVPLISEKSVWTQGGFGWSNAQRRAYMEWQQSAARECALGSAGAGWSTSSCAFVLQAKGTGGRGPSVTDVMSQSASDYKLSCSEAAGIVGTLASWGLAITPEARARIIAADCGSTTLRVKQLNGANALPASWAGNPFLSPSAASRSWSTTSVLEAAPGPAVSPSFFGLHVPYLAGAAPQVTYSWLRLWDAKTGWEPLEQNRGTYYWKSLDDAVAYAEAHGLRVNYVFGDTPAWAGPSAAFPPTSLAEYQRFVEAVVSRYGSRIAAYEVWNEPNLYTPMSESVADLVQMTKILSDTVRKSGSGSLVLTPSTTMRTDTIVWPFYNEYLTQLGSIGWPVDGYAFHTYPRAAGGPAARATAIAQFKQMLVLAKAPVKPIWDTEINYGLAGLAEPRRVISGTEAQGYLSQTFIDSVRLGVSQVDWYLWFSQEYDLLGIQLNPSTRERSRHGSGPTSNWWGPRSRRAPLQETRWSADL